MNRRLMISVMIGTVLLVIVGAAAAQGNGNGNGAGNGAANGNGNRFGAVDIVDPDNGQPWNRQQGASRGQMRIHALLPPAVEGDLPAEVVDAMIAGINDERTAYAVYESVVNQFGEVRPFTNIMQAEAQHEAAWTFMFDRYGVDLPPALEIDLPAFTSVGDACQFAYEVEVNNAALYDGMMATFADYPDLLQVTTALRNASNYNHLPAFENCAN